MSEIRVNTFKAEDGISAPSFPNGINVTGVVTASVLDASVPFLNVGSNIKLGAAGVTTATTFVGALTGNATGLSGTPNITVGSVVASSGLFSGNVSIGGTLTYEDVVNVDSVGVITARSGINVSSGGLKVLAGGSNFNATITGTATTATTVAVANEGSDAETFVTFTPSATGNQSFKTNTGLKFNASNGRLTATELVDSKGDVRDIPSNPLSGAHSSHTLVASDAGKVVVMSGGITLPAASGGGPFGGGSTVTIINGSGSAITLTQGSGLTLYFTSDGTSGNRTLGARGMATVYYIYGGNSAYISGSGLT